MAMGRRERGRQQEIFIETTWLRTAADPFYQRLNAILKELGSMTLSSNCMRSSTMPSRGVPASRRVCTFECC